MGVGGFRHWRRLFANLPLTTCSNVKLPKHQIRKESRQFYQLFAPIYPGLMGLATAVVKDLPCGPATVLACQDGQLAQVTCLFPYNHVSD